MSKYSAEEIQDKIDAGFPKFSGTHYPNEDEREALPAVIAGMNRIETAKRRAGWTHDGIEPVDVRWHTRNAGESAEFQIDVHETKDFDVNLFLSVLYSDEHPLSVIDVETHYSTLRIDARIFERDRREVERMERNVADGEGEERLKLPSYVPDDVEMIAEVDDGEIIVQWWEIDE